MPHEQLAAGWIQHRSGCRKWFLGLWSGTVEVHEAYAGGKVRGRGCDKGQGNYAAVVSLVERGGEGREYSHVVPKVTAKSVREVIRENVEGAAMINTDKSLLYYGVKNDGHPHETVEAKGEEGEGTEEVGCKRVMAVAARLRR